MLIAGRIRQSYYLIHVIHYAGIVGHANGRVVPAAVMQIQVVT